MSIYKISKIDLETIDSLDIYSLGMYDPSGMTVSHYACSLKQASASLPFEFEGVEEFLPFMKEVDFCTVVRKKIDLTAVGANNQSVEGNSRDIGKYDYKASMPSKTLDLPPGFTELYRK